MKKILTIAALFISVISFAQNTKATAPYGRNFPTDKYYIFSDTTGYGGLKIVYDTVSRNYLLDSFPLTFKNGSFVYCYLQHSMYMLDSSVYPVWVLQWVGTPGVLFGVGDSVATSTRFFNANNNIFVIENQSGHFETINDNGNYGIAVGNGGAASISVGAGGSMNLSGTSNIDGSSLTTLFQTQLNQAKTWTVITDTSDYNALVRLKYQPSPSYMVTTDPSNGQLSYSAMPVTPTWQKTIDVPGGSNLTNDNYVNLNGHLFDLGTYMPGGFTQALFHVDTAFTQLGNFSISGNRFEQKQFETNTFGNGLAMYYTLADTSRHGESRLVNMSSTIDGTGYYIDFGQSVHNPLGNTTRPFAVDTNGAVHIITDSLSTLPPNGLGITSDGVVHRYTTFATLPGNQKFTGLDTFANVKTLPATSNASSSGTFINNTVVVTEANQNYTSLKVNVGVVNPSNFPLGVIKALDVTGQASFTTGVSVTGNGLSGNDIRIGYKPTDTAYYGPFDLRIRDTANNVLATWFNTTGNVSFGQDTAGHTQKVFVNGSIRTTDTIYSNIATFKSSNNNLSLTPNPGQINPNSTVYWPGVTNDTLAVKGDITGKFIQNKDTLSIPQTANINITGKIIQAAPNTLGDTNRATISFVDVGNTFGKENYTTYLHDAYFRWTVDSLNAHFGFNKMSTPNSFFTIGDNTLDTNGNISLRGKDYVMGITTTQFTRLTQNTNTFTVWNSGSGDYNVMNKNGTDTSFQVSQSNSSMTFGGGSTFINPRFRIRDASGGEQMYMAYNSTNTSVEIGSIHALPLRLIYNNGTVGKIDLTGFTVNGEYHLSSLNTAPASSTATGTLGEIRITATYMYVCIATNTWVRTQLNGWPNTMGSPNVVAHADLSAQTSAGTVVTYTNGAADSSFEIMPYLVVTTAPVTDIIEMQVNYTDIGNTARTVTLYSQGSTTATLATTGAMSYPPLSIRAKASTTITVLTTLTVGGGTITFSAGARIVEVP